MSGKAKTWAELMSDINETARKWNRAISIVCAVPPRKRNNLTWQPEEERTVEASFIWQSVGVVRIVMKREDTARENLAKVAIAIETIRLTEVRDVNQIVVKFYWQMYPQEPTIRVTTSGTSGSLRVPSHYALLHVTPSAPLAVCEASYRALAKLVHPDQGGSVLEMQKLNSAIEFIRKEKA